MRRQSVEQLTIGRVHASVALQRLGHEGNRIGAGALHDQLGETLLDLGAANLQQRRLDAAALPFPFLVDQAQ
ncbi:hypothetical protein D3C76_1762780 [compost metagenome]